MIFCVAYDQVSQKYKENHIAYYFHMKIQNTYLQ